MVSLRCKLFVKSELEKLGLTCTSLDLGVVEIKENISKEQREALNNNLKKSGLILQEDSQKILVEKIQDLIIEMAQNADNVPDENVSDYLSKKLNYDYNYLSNTFSEVKGITIRHYIILQRIEKVKELLIYDELPLTEIAFKLNYSSVAHLSNQFKKITGLTPTYFKQMKERPKGNPEDLKPYEFSHHEMILE